MPAIVSTAERRLRQALLALPVLALTIWGAIHEPLPLYDGSCLNLADELVVCAASDMARITRQGRSALEHPRFDLSRDNPERLRWKVARNETIAFQLILRRADRQSASYTAVDILPSSNTSSTNETVQTRLYLAHYLQVNNGGYEWGPKTDVLPYPRRLSRCPGAAVSELWKPG